MSSNQREFHHTSMASDIRPLKSDKDLVKMPAEYLPSCEMVRIYMARKIFFTTRKKNVKSQSLRWRASSYIVLSVPIILLHSPSQASTSSSSLNVTTSPNWWMLLLPRFTTKRPKLVAFDFKNHEYFIDSQTSLHLDGQIQCANFFVTVHFKKSMIYPSRFREVSDSFHRVRDDVKGNYEVKLTPPRTENLKYVSFTILTAFSDGSKLHNDNASSSSELQSIPMPSNRMSITLADRKGVVGLKICFMAFVAKSRNGALSLWTAINPP